MLPMVRDLYKRFINAGRDYPAGIEHVRQKAKEAFFKNSNVNEFEVLKAVAKGRYMVREIIAISQLHKYRQMNQRYGNKQEP